MILQANIKGLIIITNNKQQLPINNFILAPLKFCSNDNFVFGKLQI